MRDLISKIPSYTKLMKSFLGWLRKQEKLLVMIPYGWLMVFFFIPFLLILKISLSEPVLAIPPYQEVFTWVKGILNVRLNLNNYFRIFTDSFYLNSFLTSAGIATITTLGCLIIGFPIAYGMACARPHWRPILLLMVVLPFWTSFLVRVYAWIGLLSNTGFINQFLQYIGLIDEPIGFLYNNFSVTVGIIYCYLPFMILPIYSVLDKIDPVYLEAAYDLGCRPWGAFWRIIIPLVRPGIVSGCALVFIPAMGEFVIPEILGASDTFMIGRIIWIEFFNNRDWPMAATVSIVMLLMFVVPIMLFNRRSSKKNLQET